MMRWWRKLRLPCKPINDGPSTPSDLHTVAIALGSNLGDRFANIETALRLLDVPSAILGVDEAKVSVIDTSFMYESAPMYVTDQPCFANCACMVRVRPSRYMPIHH